MNTPTIWKQQDLHPVPVELRNAFPNIWIQQRLVRNGIFTLDQALAFLLPAHYQPTPAEQLPDLVKGAERVISAINRKEKIGIWGDFDVDGQTATTLLVESLRLLGMQVVYHIPVRAKESHGIKLEPLKDFLTNEIDLLITCDTGISEHNAINYAQHNGVDVILTDHHSLPERLPDAYAVINPQRLPEDHALHHLAGVGVAYKLIEYVYQNLSRSEQLPRFLDLVALGTVADVALLQNENRYLVQMGLLQLRSPARLGLQQIYESSDFEPGSFNENHIGFFLAPLLNALGRLDDANPIVEFLISDDIQKTAVFANQLIHLNEQRKLLTDQTMDSALFLINREPETNTHPAIILHNPNWQAGILGIAANRLVEQYQKPVVLLTGPEDGQIHGSARSVSGLDITKAIREQKVVLSSFGGHTMAAGLAMPGKNLDSFKKGFFTTVKDQLGETVVQNELIYDGLLKFDQITETFIEELDRLAPFGPGNPPLVFATRNVNIQRTVKIGQNQRHLRLKASDPDGSNAEFLWWRADQDFIPDDTEFDLAYKLSMSTFKGKQQIQIDLESIRISPDQPAEKKTDHDSLTIDDFRGSSLFLGEIIEQHPGALIWLEGETVQEIQVANRLQLTPSEVLIVGFAPPKFSEFQKAVNTVRPGKLVLAFSYTALQPKKVLQEIMSMVLFAVNHEQGLLNTSRMAARFGYTIGIIDVGLLLLDSMGTITLHEHPDTYPLASIGGQEKQFEKKLYEDQFIFLLQEINAFRKWLQSEDSDRIEQLLKKTH